MAEITLFLVNLTSRASSPIVCERSTFFLRMVGNLIYQAT